MNNILIITKQFTEDLAAFLGKENFSVCYCAADDQGTISLPSVLYQESFDEVWIWDLYFEELPMLLDAICSNLTNRTFRSLSIFTNANFDSNLIEPYLIELAIKVHKQPIALTENGEISTGNSTYLELLIENIARKTKAFNDEIKARWPNFFETRKIFIPKNAYSVLNAQIAGSDLLNTEKMPFLSIEELVIQIGLGFQLSIEVDNKKAYSPINRLFYDTVLSTYTSTKPEKAPKFPNSIKQLISKTITNLRLIPPSKNPVISELQEREASNENGAFRYFCSEKKEVTILIVNALGLSISLWDGLIKLLKLRYQVVLWETRCGDIEKGGMENVTTIDEHAIDINTILAKEQLENVHVLAWCNGARIGLKAASDNSQIKSLILLAPVFRGVMGFEKDDTAFEKQLDNLFRQVKRAPKNADPLAKFLMKMISRKLKLDAISEAELLGYNDDKVSHLAFTPMSNGNYLKNYGERTEIDEQYDLPSLIKKIDQKVLFLLGEHDSIVSNKLIRKVAETFGKKEIASLKGGSHYMHVQNAELVYKLIAAFLSGFDKYNLLSSRIVKEALLPREPQQEQDYVLTNLADIFRFGATHFPYKKALNEGKRALSFYQLENTSTFIANRLIAMGVQSGDCVVVFAEKKLEVGVMAPAIWKANGIYVPVDAELPNNRIRYILDSLKPKVVVCSEKWQTKNKEAIEQYKAILFSEITEGFETEKQLPTIRLRNDLQDTAYIIFTSGSTGTPKGAMISHQNLLDYFVNHNEIFNFDHTSYCFSITPFHFDVSIEDTLLPLSRGSSVYLYKGIPFATLILRILERERITHAIMVSTILTILTQIKEKIKVTDLSSLQLLMTGAEVCDIDIINFWKTTFPKLKLYNAYGPTETTIVTHCYEIEEPAPDRKTIFPIGTPLSNVSSILVDSNGDIITLKDTHGELLIGGSQVMKGYWENPTETQNRIVEINDTRYYRSGDICFLDNDGNYNFVGRSDTEMKLNGRRINLAEIHKQLILQENVENVVIGVLNDPLDKKLIASLVVNDHFSKDRLDGIYENLQKTLPKYLLPTYIGISTKKFMLSTGKNDGKTLNQLLVSAIEGSKNRSKYYTLEENEFVSIK